MRYAVILAGGSGTRLWPASRRSHPKQLLSLTPDGKTLLAAAVDRGRQIADRVVIVASQDQVAATKACVPDIEVIVEPVGRNTAAAIGLAAARISATNFGALIAVMPADHHVRDKDGMAAAIGACLDAAETMDAIALVGIRPTRPETGFGYLELVESPPQWQDLAGPPFPEGLRAVRRFVEKPDLVRAKEYVASGRHLWNAGIFCLSARRALWELDKHMPETACVVHAAATGSTAELLYEDLPSTSFDHGVMEKLTSGVVAVSANVGWDDVGSWAAISEVRGVDEQRNTVVGQALVLDGHDNVVVSDAGTLIATIGVSDLVIVKSGDAILVVRKDQAQRVREIVEALNAQQELEKYR